VQAMLTADGQSPDRPPPMTDRSEEGDGDFTFGSGLVMPKVKPLTPRKTPRSARGEAPLEAVDEGKPTPDGQTPLQLRLDEDDDGGLANKTLTFGTGGIDMPKLSPEKPKALPPPRPETAPSAPGRGPVAPPSPRVVTHVGMPRPPPARADHMEPGPPALPAMPARPMSAPAPPPSGGMAWPPGTAPQQLYADYAQFAQPGAHGFPAQPGHWHHAPHALGYQHAYAVDHKLPQEGEVVVRSGGLWRTRCRFFLCFAGVIGTAGAVLALAA